LRLDRLSRAEVERYLALRFGDDALASTLTGPVFERTRGQPLFISSLLNYLIDQRAIVELEGAWRLSSLIAISQGSVPTDLVKMITHQIDHLTEDERRLLELASVAGAEFPAALVRWLVARNRRSRTTAGSIGPQGPYAGPVRRT